MWIFAQFDAQTENPIRGKIAMQQIIFLKKHRAPRTLKLNIYHLKYANSFHFSSKYIGISYNNPFLDLTKKKKDAPDPR